MICVALFDAVGELVLGLERGIRLAV